MSAEQAFQVEERDRSMGVATRVDQGVLTMRLDQPDKRNCLGRGFWAGLPVLMRQAESDPRVRCVLIESSGPVFCAGIDLSLLRNLGELGARLEASRRAEFLRRTVLSLQDSLNVLERSPLPIIAAVHGACIGGALDMICAVDMRLASREATFQALEVDLGFVPDLGTVQRLSSSLPPAVAADWLMSCRKVSAEEAQQAGFVSRVYDTAAALREHSHELALHIAAKSPIAIRGVKETARFTREHGVQASLSFTAAWQSGVFPGEDLDEAIAARSSGRPPAYHDLAVDLPEFGARDNLAAPITTNK